MKLRNALFAFAILALSACGSSPSPESGDSGTTTTTTTTAPEVSSAETFKDLSYATVSSAEKLDLYLPAGSGPFPLVVYVHGGGWRTGDKIKPFKNGIVDGLLAQGFAVASLNYRLSGEAVFPAAIQDVKSAVRWLRAHAQDYRLDSTRFGAWGDSAGAHLVSLLGTSCGVTELEGAELGNADQSSCVQAVVDWFGPTDFLQADQEFIDSGSTCPATHDLPTSGESEFMGFAIQDNPEAVKKANPITYVSSDDPPFFIQHGTADCTVPPQQSQIFYDALAPAIGAEKVTLTFFDGWEHGDSRFSTPSNLAVVINFLVQRLK